LAQIENVSNLLGYGRFYIFSILLYDKFKSLSSVNY